MISTRIATFATTAIAASAFGLAAIAGAATASAASNDQQFLANISAEGITFDSTSSAISNANQVCGYLAEGQSVGSVGNEILENSDLSTHQAAVFIVESVDAYCPGFTGQLAA